MKAMMRTVTRLTAAAVAAALAVAVGGRAALAQPAAAPTPAPSAEERLVILSEDSLWRWIDCGGDPWVRGADGNLARRKLRGKTAWGEQPASSPLPPAEWTGVDYDDSGWVRCRPNDFGLARELTPMFGTNLIAVRTRFEVKDPAQAGELHLSLAYSGGVVVYVNGKEAARGNVPAGDKAGPDAPAEDHPIEAMLTPDGKQWLSRGSKAHADRLALRTRKLDVKIAPQLLRKGANVLAIENHSAPLLESTLKARGEYESAPWAPIGLTAIQLTAPRGAAVVANTARPAGVQVWNSLPWETLSVSSYGDPQEPLRPIAVSGARNGAFSGRLVVSSGQEIRGLKATVADLVHADKAAKIPASAVRVRCAQPWAPGDFAYNYPGRRDGFDGLLDGIPATVAVDPNKTADPKTGGTGRGGKPAPGAVAPLWFTVRVPKDARPGRYEGAVTVAADGLPATTVPLVLTVSDWTVPEPVNFRSSVCSYSLPESLAQYYGVPLWSDRHFELMGKSLALMAELNARHVIVNLSIDWYGLGGNRETEVRWIKQPDGSFKHDFSVLDKHLDLVAKTIGKPSVLRFNCWVAAAKPYDRKKWAEEDVYAEGSGGFVTALDPATGKTEKMKQPCPGTPESLAFWKPVLDEIRKKVEARGSTGSPPEALSSSKGGWWDVTCVGHSEYVGGMSQDVIDNYKQIWPDGLWAFTAHGASRGEPRLSAEGCWGLPTARPRGYRLLLDPKWTRWRYYAARSGHEPYRQLADYRHAQERCITAGLDGGQLGADIFALKGNNWKSGGKYGYECVHRSGCGPDTEGCRAILAPGADGPIATERFEVYREGVVIAEAILFLQRAIEEKKIGGDLEQRVGQCLDERAAPLEWYDGASCRPRIYRFMHGWIQERDAKLLALCGEVAGKLGK